jgi:hypothetical protein
MFVKCTVRVGHPKGNLQERGSLPTWLKEDTGTAVVELTCSSNETAPDGNR